VNEGIELHDSELASVSVSGSEAVVSFSSAYIHRTTGTPGVDSGSGWLQPATLTLTDAFPFSSPVVLPATICEGFLRIGSDLHSNVIPASGDFDGAIELSIVLATAEVLIIRGQRIAIQLHGTPSFVESFNQ
jgi:hypothetical protein